MIDEYRRCAATCSHTDYSDSASVELHNRCVERMYQLVNESIEGGTTHIFYPLLDDHISAIWISHHLVELSDLPPEVIQKCFTIVEARAAGSNAEALGERLWIKEWKSKKGL